MNRHLRKAVFASVAITAGLLMTACQSGTDAHSSGKSGTGATAATEKVSDAKNAKNPADSKGVSGSFMNGKVSYLAPGKYIVSVPGRQGQEFFVADDTEVYGTGTLCGEAGAKVDAPCTLDQLEAATKKGAVGANVRMKDGIATLVTERRAAQQGSGSGTGSDSGSGSDAGSDSRDTAVEGIDKGKGVNGTWFGNVSFLAPGRYTVSDTKGTEQEFFVAEDTEILGYDDICGDATQAGTKCTEDELETAAKKGFGAEVVISNGIATSIRDDH